MITTCQTRISQYAGVDRLAGDSALSAYAELYGQVERKLFAQVASGKSAASLKSTYLKAHGIPARMFNAVRVSLDGKVSSVRGQQKIRQDNLKQQIARAENQIEQFVADKQRAELHQKRRRLAGLQHRLVTLESDVASGRVRLCFGSKRLWRKQ